MVAYSFHRQFVKPIQQGVKTGTVRAARMRHANVGERVQLYTAMRTKHCRKILTPDPICIAITPILIGFDRDHSELISAIQVGERWLSDAEIEQFAIGDGFGINWPEGTARWRMGQYWARQTDMLDAFLGLWIQWAPGD